MKRVSWLAAAVVALVAGCTASHGSPPATTDPQPLREPYLVMTGPQRGVLVWPSGANWLLLSTTDGFRHVADRTPPAVDTGGGLAIAVDGARVAAAIGAVERLVRSPLVTANRSWRWQPGEIPGAVAAARHSVALGATTTYVVLRDGRVTALEHGGWTTLTSAAQLGRGFRPDTVSAQGPHDLVVTGHGEVGRPAAYRSTDDGRHWQAVPGTAGSSGTALAPCATPSGPAVPVVDGSGHLHLVGPDGSSGAPVRVGAGPIALGCSGATVLLVDASGQVEASTDAGRHWSARGRAPDGLTDLEPTGAGAGFAVSAGERPELWRFTGDGARFTPVPLPDWVARLAAVSGGGD